VQHAGPLNNAIAVCGFVSGKPRFGDHGQLWKPRRAVARADSETAQATGVHNMAKPWELVPDVERSRKQVRHREDRSKDMFDANCNTLMPYTDAAAADEVLARVRRWLERAVIGLNLCPFAKAVYSKKQIRYALTAAATADELLAELTHELELLARSDAGEIDTVLLVHPQVLTEFLDYHFFLGEADAALRNLGLAGVFQIASFHPGYEFAGSSTDDIENFTNRSPYPILHLLREASIDRAVAAYPDAAEIFERNMDTLRRLGHAGWQRLWIEAHSKE